MIMYEDDQIELNQDSYTFTNDIAVFHFYEPPVFINMKLVIKTTVSLNKEYDTPPTEIKTVFELTTKNIVRTFTSDQLDEAIAEYNRLVVDYNKIIAGYKRATGRSI